MRRAGTTPAPTPRTRLATPAGDWQDNAACHGRDTDLFFPEPSGDAEPAKAICGGCPSRSDCLQWALDNRVEHGVYGGLDEHQRRQLLRQRREPKQVPAGGRAKAPCGTRAAYDRHRRNHEPIDELCATQGRYSKPLAGADTA